jgi:hypothetical protein
VPNAKRREAAKQNAVREKLNRRAERTATWARRRRWVNYACCLIFISFSKQSHIANFLLFVVFGLCWSKEIKTKNEKEKN